MKKEKKAKEPGETETLVIVVMPWRVGLLLGLYPVRERGF